MTLPDSGSYDAAMKTICVIGAGNGGSAIAGDMTLAGHACRLFEFPEYKANLEPIIAKGGITVTGIARTGFAKLALATFDLNEAVRGADVIMVTTQALAHERVGRELAPHLAAGPDGRPVAGQRRHARRRARRGTSWAWTRRVLLAEGVTFPYCCRRLEGPGTVNIHRIDGPRMLRRGASRPRTRPRS